MWRSLLFVPILNNRLVEGAATRGADAVVLVGYGHEVTGREG